MNQCTVELISKYLSISTPSPQVQAMMAMMVVLPLLLSLLQHPVTIQGAAEAQASCPLGWVSLPHGCFLIYDSQVCLLSYLNVDLLIHSLSAGSSPSRDVRVWVASLPSQQPTRSLKCSGKVIDLSPNEMLRLFLQEFSSVDRCWIGLSDLSHEDR